MSAGKKFQHFSDRALAYTVLPFIPRFVTPNMISWVRVFLLPFILYLLYVQAYAAGLLLFAIAALTDALDGALARVRNEITEAGKLLDPIADRGLIGLVALVLLPRFFGWPLFAALVALEAFNAAMAYRSKRRRGSNPSANWAGKVKMILECVVLILLFAFLFSRAVWFLPLAYDLLLWSLVLTLIEGFLYP